MTRIFYIDDDVDDLEIFSAAVKDLKEKNSYQYDLKYYSEPGEFMNDLKTQATENTFVFLDVNMPVSGFEILVKIRKEEQLKNFPVIMYSTASDNNTIDTSYNLGASLYAVKPSSIQSLTNLLIRISSINWADFERDRQNFQVS